MTITAARTARPTNVTALPVVAWCHDCRVDTDAAASAGVPGQRLVYLATQTRSSLDGPIDVCDTHAAMHDDFADDELFGDLDDVDGEVDLLDVAFTAGLLSDLGVAA